MKHDLYSTDDDVNIEKLVRMWQDREFNDQYLVNFSQKLLFSSLQYPFLWSFSCLILKQMLLCYQHSFFTSLQTLFHFCVQGYSKDAKGARNKVPGPDLKITKVILCVFVILLVYVTEKNWKYKCSRKLKKPGIRPFLPNKSM